MAEQFIYRKRVAGSLLTDKLDAMVAVLIEGPKATKDNDLRLIVIL